MIDIIYDNLDFPIAKYNLIKLLITGFKRDEFFFTYHKYIFKIVHSLNFFDWPFLLMNEQPVARGRVICQINL